ncbi:glucan endo-1 3-beta-glucosidas [Striga asiatica]|uniref:Glucan endo-1 3-beta-glucosidas n=1 Tax=Striga asiatica TaxID=4170 RepID=A0A5A7QJ10_STRAF|nr:glucan endo-1 3-beta-glucosidas [Striga asiatica]
MNKFLHFTACLGLFFTVVLNVTDAQVGVCYGMLGNNLPPASDVVALYKQHNITMMRLFDPSQPALEALRDSNIDVILGIPNSDLQYLAASQANADAWVQKNINNFTNVKFKYIAVGNEVDPSQRASVLLAMQNIHKSVSTANLEIKVSTVIDTGLIANSYPPENGTFGSDVFPYITPIVRFLVDNSGPLLVNVYPYFAYINNKAQISLDYALFTSSGVVMPSGVRYQNLFYAIVDSIYAALEKINGSTVRIVVSESGWPSAGGDTTTFDYAKTYLTNMIQRVKSGTPKRPGEPIETYVFAMFDENQKSPEYEKNFGVFTPDKQLKYPINF